MAFSVLTNAESFAALRNLGETNRNLATTQTQINTGLAVAGAQDNGAIFSIAQRLRADVAGLNAAQSSLDNATSALDVGIAAAEAVSDLLIEVQELAVAAGDAGLDTASRASLNNDFTALVAQIDTITTTAEFNGINVVDAAGATTTEISAIVDPDGTPGNAITVSGVNLTVGNLLTTSGTGGINDLDGSLARAAVTEINTAIDTVNQALSSFGAASRRLEIQSDFSQLLSDSIEVGIGNLVDADLAEASADLQALQVQQQLGLQALSIANQAPSAVLSLFG